MLVENLARKALHNRAKCSICPYIYSKFHPLAAEKRFKELGLGYGLRERLDLGGTLLFTFNATLGFDLYLFGLNLFGLGDG